MSNSAYQRATTDMKKAGINPMLAYMQGGASTPSVSAPSAPSASAPTGSGGSSGAMAHAQPVDALVKSIPTAISSAMEVKRLKKELNATDSQIEVNKELANTQKTVQFQNSINSALAMAKIPQAQAEAKMSEAEAGMKGNKIFPYINYGVEKLSNIIPVAAGATALKMWLKRGLNKYPSAPRGYKWQTLQGD